MALRDTIIRIKTVLDNRDSKRGLSEQTKLLKDEKRAVDDVQSASKRLLEQETKRHKAAGKLAKESFENLGRGAKETEGRFRQVNEGVERLEKGLLSIKNIALVGLGIEVGSKLFEGLKIFLEEGREDLAVAARLKREFGENAEFISSVGEGVARKAGVANSSLLSALTPIAEAVDDIRAGQLFRGKVINDEQAESLKKQTLQVGAHLLENAATVVDGIDIQTLGEALAAAGTGNEGLKRLGSLLHLNRASVARIVKANEKAGGLYKLLGAKKAAEFGIGKNEIAGQGTLLEVLFAKSGITDAAAEAKRATFEHQVKSIGSTLNDALGDAGRLAVERLNHEIANGGNLAKRLQDYLASDEGKQNIENLSKLISGSVQLAAESLKEIGSTLAQISKFVDDHPSIIKAAEYSRAFVKKAVFDGGPLSAGVQTAYDITKSKIEGFKTINAAEQFSKYGYGPRKNADLFEDFARKQEFPSELTAYLADRIREKLPINHPELFGTADLDKIANARKLLENERKQAPYNVPQPSQAERVTQVVNPFGVANRGINLIVNPPVGLSKSTIPDFINQIIPELTRQLGRGMEIATGGGAAPVSAVR